MWYCKKSMKFVLVTLRPKTGHIERRDQCTVQYANGEELGQLGILLGRASSDLSFEVTGLSLDQKEVSPSHYGYHAFRALFP